MKIYHLKVSLFGYHEQPINKLHRIIEISENSTFEELHEAIFEAFDRFDPHLYTFFITKKDIKDMHDIMDAPAITNPHSVNETMLFDSKPKNTVTTKLKDAKLKEKDVFHYWFDFGDDWWHRIRVERITTNNRIKKDFVKITKKVGKSPAQYEDYDDDEFGEFGEFEKINGVDVNDIVFGHHNSDSGAFINPKELDELGIGEEDLFFLLQTMNENKTDAMQKIVDKYGIDKVVKMLELIGVPDVTPLKVMLNNMPIIHFLESCEDPNITLQQEHQLLKNLIDTLQTRLAELEQSIAQAGDNTQVVSTKKGK